MRSSGAALSLNKCAVLLLLCVAVLVRCAAGVPFLFIPVFPVHDSLVIRAPLILALLALNILNRLATPVTKVTHQWTIEINLPQNKVLLILLHCIETQDMPSSYLHIEYSII